jgi:seryl-tRNA synthetase
MLDIKFIRENKDLITEAARKKHIKFDVAPLLTLDDKRKGLLLKVEEKRKVQNDMNQTIVRETSSTIKLDLIEKMRVVKEDLQKEEEELREIMKEWQMKMVEVPNVPDVSVPEGESDADNKEMKKWGDLPKFDFSPKDHIEIMERLGMADFERGTKVAGFRGYFLKGDGVRLSFAIWNYALEFFSKKGFAPMLVPSLVRRENLLGTGFIPQGEEDLYKTQDMDFLAGTAEVALMGYHGNEVLDKKEFPKKYLGFSPCFRREAGSHSKDVKGLIRVHEFYKFEQVILCEASHEESVRMHEELTHNTEEFIESLGISYRTVINCGGDLGLGQVKKYDIELWVPLENKYREIASSSYFHDFQTRRLNIRYKDDAPSTDSGQVVKMKYAHSLNNTAIATPRILVSLVENYQDASGNVLIPEVLQKYMGGQKVISNK